MSFGGGKQLSVWLSVSRKSISDTEKRNRVKHRAQRKQENCPSWDKDKVGDVSGVSGTRCRGVGDASVPKSEGQR